LVAGTERSYLPEVDGLRAIAVGTVFLFHLSPGLLPGGFVGVDVFFVVSGFLITHQLAKFISDGRFSILGFYQRRIARIAPAALLVILAVFAAAALFYMRIDVARTGTQGIAAAVSAINFLLVLSGNYFEASAHSRPFLHYWSLAVEEQYYLFYPFILWWLLRRTSRPITWLAILGALSFALCAAISYYHQSVAYYMLPTRAWQLVAGAVLALGHDRLKPHVQPWRGALLAGGAALAVIAAVVVRPTNFPGFQALLPVLAASMVIAGAGAQSGLAGRALASKPMLWVGVRSYVLYLWHWPVFSFVGYTLFDFGNWVIVPVKILVALALTEVTHRYFEMPARRWLNMPQRQKIALFGFFAAVALTCLAGQMLRNTIRQPRPGDLPAGGVQVNPTGHKWVVVVGDSTAMVMHPGLMARARQLDARINFMSMSQVNELPGERGSHWPKIDVYLGNRRPDLILVSEAWSHKVEALGDAKFSAAVRELSSRGREVVLIGEAPIPLIESLDRSRIASRTNPPPLLDPQAEPQRRRSQSKLEKLALPNVRFVPIDDPFLAPGGKARIRDQSGQFLYYDRRHLSDRGLRIVYPRIFGAIETALSTAGARQPQR
jgi:peptidoglycan/LPS O-acetylase OafA/YrhL